MTKKTIATISAAVLAAALLGKPGAAQSSADYLTNTLHYDGGLVGQSLPGAQTSDAASLLSALNARRDALGLAHLSYDPSLTAAADYQVLDEMKLGFTAPYAYLADGRTMVSAGTLASNFGSTLSDVQVSQFSNGQFAYLYGNWAKLVSAWWGYNGAVRAIVGDGSIASVGVAVYNTGQTMNGYPVVRWELIAGK